MYIHIYIYVCIYTYRVKTQGSPKRHQASGNPRDGKMICFCVFTICSAFFECYLLRYISSCCADEIGSCPRNMNVLLHICLSWNLIQYVSPSGTANTCFFRVSDHHAKCVFHLTEPTCFGHIYYFQVVFHRGVTRQRNMT